MREVPELYIEDPAEDEEASEVSLGEGPGMRCVWPEFDALLLWQFVCTACAWRQWARRVATCKQGMQGWCAMEPFLGDAWSVGTSVTVR